jgi:hypothetical protein
MAIEQIEVFAGSGKNIQHQVNNFLTSNADKIEVVSFQVVDNSASTNSKASDGFQVFFLMYRPKK